MNARAMMLAQDKLLNHPNRGELDALLKEDGLNEVRDKAKSIIGDHVQWIKPENIEALKKSARVGIAKLDVEALAYNDAHRRILIGIADPKNSSTYQEKLKAVGIANTDLLKKEDYPALLDTIRNKAFEMQVEKLSPYSPYGKKVHKDLITTFKAAKPEKKEIILRNLNNLEKSIQHLFHATNTDDVKRMLGVEDNVAELVTEENGRLEKFKKIHSLEAAKILANLYATYCPSEELSDNVINAFNSKFFENDGAAYTKDDYAELLRGVFGDITGELPDAIDDQKFYNAFGLNNDGSAVLSNELENLVGNQRISNLHLATDIHNHAADPLRKELMQSFMRVDKRGIALDGNDVDNLWTFFKDSKSYEEFKKKITDNISSKLSEDWTKQFTTADFDKLKLQQLKGLDTTQKVREYVDARLDELSKVFALGSQRFWDETQLRRFRENFNDRENWFNPAFMGKSKADAEKMKPKFEALARNIDIIIQEREYQREAIEALIRNLPGHTGEGTGNYPKEEDEKIRKKLDGKIKEIDAALENHKKSRDALQDVLDKMQEAIESKKVIQLFGSDPDVVSEVFKKGTPEYEEAKGKDLSPDHVRRTHITHGHVKEMKMHEIDSDQVRIWDVKTTKGGLTTRGRIIEEHGLTPSAKVYASDKQKITPTKLTIDMPKGGRTTEQKELIEEARVKTAMVAVCQLFAKLDVPPDEKHPININCSDPEDAKYFWTAVKIVQKELKDTKLAFKDNAIQGDSIKYVSKTQKGKLGWKDDSVYKTVFEKESNKYIWKQKTDELKGHVSEKFKHDKEKKESSAAATQLFRKEVKKQISESEKHLEEIHKGPQVH
ncbi:hypothetical protein [Legionella israelensis]|nr:hypothetical protein [Legionella israelensis]